MDSDWTLKSYADRVFSGLLDAVDEEKRGIQAYIRGFGLSN